MCTSVRRFSAYSIRIVESYVDCENLTEWSPSIDQTHLPLLIFVVIGFFLQANIGNWTIKK